MTTDLQRADRLLVKLTDCRIKRDKYDDFTITLIKDLRKLNVPWSAIGDACGISHQGARQRYGKLVAS